MGDDTKKQSISYDNQNFNIDIDKIYNDFMKEIDSIRSYTNFNKDIAEKYIKSLITTKKDSKTIEVGVENKFQESRCHAFYRLIGLPVIAANGANYYSPGHDNIKEPRNIYLDNKIDIALNPIEGFDKLIIARENNINALMQNFADPTSIDAAVTALSSGSTGETITPNLRKFNVPFDKDPAYDDMKVDNQSYTLGSSTLSGDNTFELREFENVDGSKPQKLNTNRKHIIKPFMVNGKIDFTVRPATRRVCVPFVYDNTNTLIATNVSAKRPLIEKLIRDRISIGSSTLATTGPSNDALNEYVKTIGAIQDEDLVEKINNGSIYSINEKREFVKYVFIIQQMMKKLVQATQTIGRAQSLYYWVPEPSVNGPEEGCKVRDVFVPINMANKDLLTPLDRDIIIASIKNSVNEFVPQTSPTNTTSPDSFAFSSFSNTFDSDSTSALGNEAAGTMERLVAKRKEVLSKAGDALRTVEIIMGEFSGLGLCDIIAIVGALHILPIKSLVGLIDRDAFDRMEKILGTNATVEQEGLATSLSDLSDLVKGFYTIMDKIYEDELMNNGFTPD